MKIWIVYWDNIDGEGQYNHHYFRTQEAAQGFFERVNNAEDDPWEETRLIEVSTDD